MKKTIFIILFFPAIGFCTDTGFLSPTTCVSSTTGGSSAVPVAWTNPSNGLTQNNSYATATFTPVVGYDTKYLYCYGYNASLPNSTPTGIQVKLYRKSVSCNEDNTLKDNDVKIVKNGVAVGDNHAVSFDWGCTDGAAFTFPHPDPIIDSLWGTTFTYTEINDGSFGVVISVTENDTSGSETAGIDTAQIKVYYTAIAATQVGIGTRGVYWGGVGTK